MFRQVGKVIVALLFVWVGFLLVYSLGNVFFPTAFVSLAGDAEARGFVLVANLNEVDPLIVARYAEALNDGNGVYWNGRYYLDANHFFASGDVNFSPFAVKAFGDSNFLNVGATAFFGNGSGLTGLNIPADTNFQTFFDFNGWYWSKYSPDLNAIILILAKTQDTNFQTFSDFNKAYWSKYDLNGSFYGKGDINANFVPYIGATKGVNLGSQSLTTTGTGRYSSLWLNQTPFASPKSNIYSGLYAYDLYSGYSGYFQGSSGVTSYGIYARNDASYAAGNGSTNVYGAIINSDSHNASGTAYSTYGIGGGTYHYGAGNLTYLHGLDFRARVQDSSATVSTVRGIYVDAGSAGTSAGTISTLVGVDVSRGITAGETIGTTYGIRVSSPTTNANTTYNAGLYIEDQTVAGATNFAIKTMGGKINFAAGDVNTGGDLNANRIFGGSQIMANSGGRSIGFDTQTASTASLTSNTIIYFRPSNTAVAYMDSTQVSYYDNVFMRMGVAGTAGVAPRQWGDWAYQVNDTNRIGTLSFGLSSVDYSVPAKLIAGRTALFCDGDDMTYNFSHPPQANPTIFIQSKNQTINQWLGLTHDGNRGVISTGSGDLNFYTPVGTGVRASGYLTAGNRADLNYLKQQGDIVAAHDLNVMNDANITRDLNVGRDVNAARYVRAGLDITAKRNISSGSIISAPYVLAAFSVNSDTMGVGTLVTSPLFSTPTYSGISDCYDSLAAGQVCADGGIVYSITDDPSDQKFKSNVLPLPFDTAKFFLLKPSQWDWSGLSKTGKGYGLVAQDIELLYPELVRTGQSKKMVSGVLETTEYKTIDYLGIIALQTKKIQELEERITKLEVAK